MSLESVTGHDPAQHADTRERAAATNTVAPVNPRLWPAVVIVLLQSAAIFVPLFVSPGSFVHFMGMFFGPLVGALLLVIWWLFASRLPRRDRWIGLGLVGLVYAATVFMVDKNLHLGLVVYVLPAATTALAAALVVTGRLAWPSRRWAVLAAVVAAIVFWTGVRVEGWNGNMVPDFTWRWRPTPEQAYLARTADLSLPSTAPVPPSGIEVLPEAGPGDWPGFRGPERDGRLFGVAFSTDWTNHPPRELWRRPVGPGWSSFAVIGDRVFTQEQHGEEETVTCYDAASGSTLWVNRIAAHFEETASGSGPRATPQFHEGKLYALGATGILQCIDPLSGESLWKSNLVEDTGASTPGWGFSSSPLVVGDKVIVFAGAEGGKSVAAYDRASGKLAWTSGVGTQSYSSPHFAQLAGVDQVLVATDAGLQSFEPETGAVLWTHEWSPGGMMRIVQPLVIDSDTVLLPTGYGAGTRRLHVRNSDQGWQVEEQWTSRFLNPYFNDLVYYDGNLYGFDGGIFACIDAAEGKRKWKGGRYGHGQALLVADMGVLLVLSETGEVNLVEATPDGHHELARMQALQGKTWNHPVIAHGKLFVRNGEEAACYELPPVQ